MAEAELVSFFEKACKAADRAVSNGAILPAEEVRCQETLKAMGAVEVSTALLLSTQVGKRLRKLTKHQSSKISASAQQLLEEWKKVVADEAASRSGTPKDASPVIKPETPARTSLSTTVKKEVKLEAKTEMKVCTSKSSRVGSKSTVPSPKVESKSVSPSPRVETKNARPAPQSHPASKSASPSASQSYLAGKSTTASSAAPSSSANGSASGLESKIGHLPKSGDPNRDRFRELLLDAFKKCCSELTDEHSKIVKSTDFVKVTLAVETVLFSKLGLFNGKEKAKYRSILFNLKDQNNPDFRRRVLMGEIKSEEIVNMTADDMASDARKKENEVIREKALFECERGMQNVASTDQFRCGKCGQRKTTYFQLQTRSADEPMTTFVTCVNCNARWKFC
ncbi:transcription elongation factor TFIIS [Physcomitrium patens]|uniref:Transcription elongation factor n=1 Tax=Physcomitrium patens TaxID=3218 RepID=A0A2K1IBX2_PHYPA|nr:transcription elongation factor TFIIS-like [Physcomitrium patens]PNR26769.1 hypothetical protein PHYPA_030250 [Physcomitrium patens]|eukprot:XP_024367084.1 transcription elongation factor TFIIS-like [Physcomitrella patens]